MRRRDEFDLEDRPSALGNIIAMAAAVLVVIAAIAAIYFLLFGADHRESTGPGVVVGEIVSSEAENIPAAGETEESPIPETADSSEEGMEKSEQQEQEPVEILIGDGPRETATMTQGIDVSRYQGNIDWQQVAASGVEFAMIRVGYRTMSDGEIVEDSSARYNLQEATANGIRAGAYFFSTAVTEAEAVEEARWVAELIAPYKITYPVAYNCEGFENGDSRQAALTKEERTELATIFLKEIHEYGYTPMFYASKGELEGDSKWVASQLEKSFKMWISWYPEAAYPETPEAGYAGLHSMWQHTNSGTVPGIDGQVDRNVAYFGYEREAEAKDPDGTHKVEANVEAGHNFTEVNETVTAKDATNLRDIPSQDADAAVKYTLKNGETALRTGISTSGWSRVSFNGQTYYAVSSYLTTDLTVKAPDPTPAPEADDGIKTKFTACDDQVSPKIEVNLRTLPSVTNPEARVVVTLPYGSVVRRTGINEDLGWSRVEYEGQVLYCVSSYVYVVE